MGHIMDIDVDDKLHVAAAAYANGRLEAARAHRKLHNEPKITRTLEGEIWVAHYEGYKAGTLHGKH